MACMLPSDMKGTKDMKEYLVETTITEVSTAGEQRLVAQFRNNLNINCDHEDLDFDEMKGVWCADCGQDLTAEHERDMDYEAEDLAEIQAEGSREQ